MESFTKIINFIMQIIDLIKSFFNKSDDGVEPDPEHLNYNSLIIGLFIFKQVRCNRMETGMIPFVVDVEAFVEALLKLIRAFLAFFGIESLSIG